MIPGIYVSAAGARAQSLRHDVIANNLANVNTVGFKRQLAIIGAVGSMASGSAPVAPDLVASPHENGSGPLLPTERPGDLALDGEGYFVLTDGRQEFYTRAGHFDVDADGRLVTADHRFAVEGAGRRPIRVDRAQPFSVTAEGRVIQNGTEVGQLAVVTFRAPDLLVNLGDGLVAASAGAGPVPTTTAAVVRQGYLEHSTVEAVRELVAMLEAYRAYEANVSLIGHQDATLGRLINDAGRLA